MMSSITGKIRTIVTLTISEYIITFILKMVELRHACDRMDLNTIKTMIDQSPHLINEVSEIS